MGHLTRRLGSTSPQGSVSGCERTSVGESFCEVIVKRLGSGTTARESKETDIQQKSYTYTCSKRRVFYLRC